MEFMQVRPGEILCEPAAPQVYSYYVLMPADAAQTLRLIDLKPHEHIFVRCQCGRVVQYMPGLLQRRYRLPSTTLIYDLQFRLRCSHCRAFAGFEITVLDMRNIGDNSKSCPERVIVGKRS